VESLRATAANGKAVDVREPRRPKHSTIAEYIVLHCSCIRTGTKNGELYPPRPTPLLVTSFAAFTTSPPNLCPIELRQQVSKSKARVSVKASELQEHTYSISLTKSIRIYLDTRGGEAIRARPEFVCHSAGKTTIRQAGHAEDNKRAYNPKDGLPHFESRNYKLRILTKLRRLICVLSAGVLLSKSNAATHACEECTEPKPDRSPSSTDCSSHEVYRDCPF